MISFRSWISFLCLVIPMNCAFAVDFDAAVDLYGQKKYEEARQSLQSAFNGAPYTPLARYYDAMCLYGLGEGKRFLGKVDVLRKDYATLTPQQRVELDRKYAVTSYRERSFAQAKANAEKFVADYPDSADLTAMRGVATLSLYELGRKKMREAGVFAAQNNPDAQARKSAQGQEQLRSFLQSVQPLDMKNEELARFTTPERVKEAVWTARILTGGGPALLSESQTMTPSERESCAFLNAVTHQTCWPAEREANLELLRGFAESYPSSARVADARRRIADLHYEIAETLLRESDAATTGVATPDAEDARQRASEHIDEFRAYCRNALGDTSSTLTASRQAEIEERLLMTYCLLDDYPVLLAEAKSLASRHTTGTRLWAVSRTYEAISLAHSTPPDYSGAMSILEAVLKAEIEDDEPRNPIAALASRWRTYVADRMNAR